MIAQQQMQANTLDQMNMAGALSGGMN